MPDPNIVIAGYAETAIEFKSGRSAYDFGGELFCSWSALLTSPRLEGDGGIRCRIPPEP